VSSEMIQTSGFWLNASRITLLAALLASCGGGGGSDGSVPTGSTNVATGSTNSPTTGVNTGAPIDQAVPRLKGCAPAFAAPAKTGCDGLSLTSSQAIATRTPGIVETNLPNGLTSYRFEGKNAIELKDEGCTALGKNGADFSVSMWLKATAGDNVNAQILSGGRMSTFGGGATGFVIQPEARWGRTFLIWSTGAGPGQAYKEFRSPPFDANTWVYVTFTYKNGDAARGTMSINGATTSGELHGNVYRAPVVLGAAFNFGQKAPFEVADIRSYPRALSSTETRSLWLEVAGQFGLSGTELASGIAQLRSHFKGSARLDADAFAAAANSITKNAALIGTRETLMMDALALTDEYEKAVSPLFVGGDTAGGISNEPVAGESATKREARSMLDVFQAIHDEVFAGEAVAACTSKLQGRSWKTADHFPGKVTASLDASKVFTVKVDGNVPAVWGIPVAFATDAKVRPTGLYLPPGSVGKITVPPALVNAGYAVRIGAHSWDHSAKPNHLRMHRVMKRFEIMQQTTLVANPLGGGVYIEVPYMAKAGMVNVQVQGVVEAPFFSLRSFDKMSSAQWQARRTAGVPWTDFVTDHYMTQVPSNWIYAKNDPTQLLQDWDKSMKGVSEFVGIPPDKRNDVVMWSQTDLQLPGGAHGIGYPQVNIIYNPRGDARGDSTHPAVTNPLKNQTEFHELGHSQLFSKFGGEVEALVNFPIVYVSTQKFGNDLDVAFGNSFGNNGPTRDIASIDWMLTVNFGKGAEMNRSNTVEDEFRYQARGYAKYADIAGLFGWKALTDFYSQENLAFMAKTPGDGLSGEDSRILRLSVAAGADLTPLIHFWGIQPDNATALKNAIAAKGLLPSPAIKARLLHYRTLIPADAPAFLTFFNVIYPGMPTSSTPYYGSGWYHARKSQWNAPEAQKARLAIDAIVAKYFP
jgi:N-terminal domain of M60-like peptidases/Concanavalin A-like lectin/glucanases superfamily/Peptidase M60, enhancin and enhancin-like